MLKIATMENFLITAQFHSPDIIKNLFGVLNKYFKPKSGDKLVFYLTPDKFVIHHNNNISRRLWFVSKRKKIFQYKYNSSRPYEIYSLDLSQNKKLHTTLGKMDSIIFQFGLNNISIINKLGNTAIVPEKSMNITGETSGKDMAAMCDFEFSRDCSSGEKMRVIASDFIPHTNTSGQLKLEISKDILRVYTLSNKTIWELQLVSCEQNGKEYSIIVNCEDVKMLYMMRNHVNNSIIEICPQTFNEDDKIRTIFFLNTEYAGFGKFHVILIGS